MHETLKIIVSTLVIILVTSVIFFALYFLAPSVSEDLFGISYRSSRENPVETFQSSFMPSEEKSAEESSSEIESVTAETVTPSESEDAVLTESGEEVMAQLSDESVVNMLSTQIGSLSETLTGDGAVAVFNSIGAYLDENGLDISQVFSNRNLFDFANGGGSDAIKHVASFLEGEN